MRMFGGISGILLLAVTSASAATPPQQQKKAAANPPSWAYPINPPDDKPAMDDGSLKRVPGSSKSLTLTQVTDFFNIPDWNPDGHPAMPPVVEHGRRPAVRGCGYCHLPNAQGRPENASLAGLPVTYIVQQVMDIKSGARRCSEPRMGPPGNMVAIAQSASLDEAKAAAEYFSSLQYKSWIKVIETDTVMKTKVKGSMLVAADGGGKEPIGHRIVETPVNLELTELRDDASGFIAYVPVGSIEKGKTLVMDGGDGKTDRCWFCHGEDLRGQGPVPRLAGRSPSYLFRQLYDFQTGSRHGKWSPLMQDPVAQLTEDDMLNIAAYLSSLEP
ncbi:MAG TPA: c-type cytochrome [Candidatus Acidoferrales bacterium]|nr:c-type cytochrome [Candidatus Acidoferrales bacterium]